MTAEANVLATLRATGLRAGMSRTKGLFIKIFSGQSLQRNRGNAIADVERVFDRGFDRYTEKVTLRDSGEMLHMTDEPLSEHIGHGSDKPKN